MSTNIGIVIVEKNGNLKSLTVKSYKQEELFKKCGFKKSEGFELQPEWSVKLDGVKYILSLFAKTEGNANMENKYDFPPPNDNTLYFGSCAIVCNKLNEKNETVLTSLSLDLWEKMYEKLFGGFESLEITNVDDEAEEDELDNISDEKKTKNGYLKDGFVVDSEEDEVGSEEDEEEDEDEETDEESEDVEEEIEDIGSELSEDEYDSEEDA